MMPRVSPRLLPPTAASFASNAKLTNGALRGFRSPLRVVTVTLPAGRRRLRLDREVDEGGAARFPLAAARGDGDPARRPGRRGPRLPDLPARRVALLLPARRPPGEPRAVPRHGRPVPPLLLDRTR